MLAAYLAALDSIVGRAAGGDQSGDSVKRRLRLCCSRRAMLLTTSKHSFSHTTRRLRRRRAGGARRAHSVLRFTASTRGPRPPARRCFTCGSACWPRFLVRTWTGSMYQALLFPGYAALYYLHAAWMTSGTHVGAFLQPAPQAEVRRANLCEFAPLVGAIERGTVYCSGKVDRVEREPKEMIPTGYHVLWFPLNHGMVPAQHGPHHGSHGMGTSTHGSR